MGVAEIISGFEAAGSIAELQLKMQLAIEDFGFSAYNFFDAGRAHLDVPLYFGTTGEAWENEYRSNQFVTYDPTLSLARRINVGFRWGKASLPPLIGRKKPKALQLMEAAQDHGFQDGYILPFHFVDLQGRSHSALVALFWKGTREDLDLMLGPIRKHELNLVMMYWVQKIIAVLGERFETRSNFTNMPLEFTHLTDRERDVLTWAGRGHSVADTSEVLKIGQETVKTHLIHAMEKLQSTNKTHAVAKAVRWGLIDI
jgi:LuxR family transcriptional regulator, quorum-sensing system regulator BjaR1